MQNKFALVLAMSLLGTVVSAQEAASPTAAPVTAAPPATTPPAVVAPAAPVALVKINYTLRQIIKTHSLVIVESSAPVMFPEGKVFLATLKDGTQCTLSLKEISGTLLTFDSSFCDKMEQLTVSTPVEPALIPTPLKATAAAAPAEQPNAYLYQPPKRYEWAAVSIYLTAADKATFNDIEVTDTGSTGKGDAKFSVDSGVGFGASFISMREQSWGFSGSVNFEPARDIKSVTFSGVGGTSTGDLVDTKISVLFGEANLIYRWNTFYLPFGLNVSAPRISSPGSSTVDINGSVGAFLGVGFLLNENCVVELFVRSIGFRMTETFGTTTIDYGYGSLSGSGLGFKYLF